MNEHRDPVTAAVIGAAIEVHRLLGPGLLESAYEVCLGRELAIRGIDFVRQVALPVKYKGTQLDCGYRMDFVVPGRLVVEVKSVDAIHPVHQAQLITYLKLSQIHVGLLVNFNVLLLKDGVQRFVV